MYLPAAMGKALILGLSVAWSVVFFWFKRLTVLGVLRPENPFYYPRDLLEI